MGKIITCLNTGLYNQIMNSCTVKDLKIILKHRLSYLPKNFYKLKKKHLVYTATLNQYVTIIIRFFKFCLKKKLQNNKMEIEYVEKCPISLIPISEIEESDLFTHDNIQFSKEYLIGYFKSSYDFTNPITKRELKKEDILRLKSDEISKIFEDKDDLRDRMVTDIQDFSFYENDIEAYFYNLVLTESVTLGRIVDDEEYLQITALFHHTWLNMVRLDIHRTECVLRGLYDKMFEWFNLSYSNRNRVRIAAGEIILRRYTRSTGIYAQNEARNEIRV